MKSIATHTITRLLAAAVLGAAVLFSLYPARSAEDSAAYQATLTSEVLEEPTGNVPYRAELMRALRGDKDAAYRVATMYRQGSHGLSRDPLRTMQWLRIAAELGNGRASWEVANIYNRDGAMAEAARFEAKAVRDGYRIPRQMPNRGLEY